MSVLSTRSQLAGLNGIGEFVSSKGAEVMTAPEKPINVPAEDSSKLVSLAQPFTIPSPNFVAAGNCIFVTSEQPPNAVLPIVVALGRLIVVKARQALNALPPIVVALSNSTFFNATH